MIIKAGSRINHAFFHRDKKYFYVELVSKNIDKRPCLQ